MVCSIVFRHGGKIDSLSFGYAKEEAVYGLENSDISCNKMAMPFDQKNAPQSLENQDLKQITGGSYLIKIS